jgi:hypothetical protein
LDLDDGTFFLALCEAVIRENPASAEVLDRLYTEALAAPAPSPAAPAQASRSSRNREIQKALRLFGA